MSFMMNPVLPVSDFHIPLQVSGKGNDSETSFAAHFNRHLDEKFSSEKSKLGAARKDDDVLPGESNQRVKADQGEKRDKLGVAEKGEAPKTTKPASRFASPVKSSSSHGAEKIDSSSPMENSVEGEEVLAQLASQYEISEADLAQLRNLALSAGENGDIDLQDIADSIGMAKEDVALLSSLFVVAESGKENISMQDIGAALDLDEEDISLLQSLISSVGYDSEGALSKLTSSEEPPADGLPAAYSEKDKESVTIASLLAQFMIELQEAADKKLSVPGEWKVELPEAEQLQEFASHAGMDESDFVQLLNRLDIEDNTVSLADFFGAVNQHFEKMQETPEIVVPESELPFLETLLARMGVDDESLNGLVEKSVSRDGALDLNKFLQALQQVEKSEGYIPVVLSDSESEQLQNLFAQAGVTLETQNELLPERFLHQAMGNSSEAGKPVVLGMERLQNMISRAMTNVKQQQPEIDLPALLNDLQKMMKPAGFEEQSVGWTPVVQETVTALFQKLQELVDLTRIKIEGGQLAEEQMLDEDFAQWVKMLDEKFSSLSGNNEKQGSTQDFFNKKSFEGEGFVSASLESNTQSISTVSPVTEISPEMITVAAAGKAAPSSRIPAQQLQQQVLNQLASGVTRGLQSREHHLVLRLYPQDLGEVKVNMTIHDDKVSIAFNMENVRVKEILEGNMEEFKESMNQKGFSLGECSVSVGGQDDTAEQWQKFAMARKVIEAARERVATIPDNALYNNISYGKTGSPQGINLIV